VGRPLNINDTPRNVLPAMVKICQMPSIATNVARGWDDVLVALKKPGFLLVNWA